MNKPIVDNPMLFMEVICDGFAKKLKDHLNYSDDDIKMFKTYYYVGARTACEALIHAGVIDSTKIDQLIYEIESHHSFQHSPLH